MENTQQAAQAKRVLGVHETMIKRNKAAVPESAEFRLWFCLSFASLLTNIRGQK